MLPFPEFRPFCILFGMEWRKAEILFKDMVMENGNVRK